MTPARPVLKYAGGKTQLLPEILKRLPAKIGTYYEPFIGGGAVFFALAAEGRFERAVISDTNYELVELYATIRDDIDGLIRELLSNPIFFNDERAYYVVRAATDLSTPASRAARTIYLNKTGFNGLYRVNKSGLFNVPFGRYKNPKICDEENLRACARELQGVQITWVDFEVMVGGYPSAGDAVYLDPPYLPLSKTSSFTAYGKLGFGPDDHRRLAAYFDRQTEQEAAALLSNADMPLIRQLFAKHRVESVSARRTINSKGEKRGAVSELLVSNRFCR